MAVLIAFTVSAPAAQTPPDVNSKTYVMTGTVTAVSATAIVVARNSVAMLFVVEGSTRVIGKGLATKLLLRKFTLPDAVRVGDRARVTYRQSGTSLVAVELRVSREEAR
jgi:hypothetical protein